MFVICTPFSIPEQLNNIFIPMHSRPLQGRQTKLFILGIYISAFVDEQSCHIQMATLGSSTQRCPAVLVRSVNVRAFIETLLNHLYKAMSSSPADY
ncbi:hypothetical protein MKX07_006276 [Trichoderma sp. CBMAI-0711]|uniref:Uncharacterized protein n=1 Tax=Trichoderma parareesei TaxID=858221 RepID=A0A2H2Z1C6_TRIPA|nr:hypothetical protein MKX07_006276 [Trichoderma sp. CBMAI-0711]OTA02207.1 hypothetical protein A9Z42_0025620 [Trichoderma parareesei]